MFGICKRTGSYLQPIHGAPSFENHGDAERWARKYIEENPGLFPRGLAAIEVRRNLDDLNAQLGTV